MRSDGPEDQERGSIVVDADVAAGTVSIYAVDAEGEEVGFVMSPRTASALRVALELGLGRVGYVDSGGDVDLVLSHIGGAN